MAGQTPLYHAPPRFDYGAEDSVVQEFGDLYIGSTYFFTPRWNDKGSGAHGSSIALWHPESRFLGGKELRPLGSVFVQDYDDVNYKLTASLIGDPDAMPDGEGSVVRSPVGYEKVYDDVGSGADKDGSIWRAIPPEGYVALGHVAAAGYSKPGLHDIWCVRRDLVGTGSYDAKVWTDAGSKGRTDVGLWTVRPAHPPARHGSGVFEDVGRIPLGVHTFIAVNSHVERPDQHPHVLTYTPIIGSTDRSSYWGAQDPPGDDEYVVNRTVTLPLGAVFAPDDKKAIDSVETPWVTLEQASRWEPADEPESKHEESGGGGGLLGAGLSLGKMVADTAVSGARLAAGVVGDIAAVGINAAGVKIDSDNSITIGSGLGPWSANLGNIFDSDPTPEADTARAGFAKVNVLRMQTGVQSKRGQFEFSVPFGSRRSQGRG